MNSAKELGFPILLAVLVILPAASKWSAKGADLILELLRKVFKRDESNKTRGGRIELERN
jgi:hypothetical protein